MDNGIPANDSRAMKLLDKQWFHLRNLTFNTDQLDLVNTADELREFLQEQNRIDDKGRFPWEDIKADKFNITDLQRDFFDCIIKRVGADKITLYLQSRNLKLEDVRKSCERLSEISKNYERFITQVLKNHQFEQAKKQFLKAGDHE